MCSKADDDLSPHPNGLRQNSSWPKEIECGLGIKTGECINGECICFQGYQHDLSYIRFRNCSLPTAFFPVIIGIQLFSLLIVIPFVFMKFRNAVSLAKTSLLSTLISCILYLIFCISFILHRFVLNSFTFFCLYLVIGTMSISNGFTVYSLVSPLSAVAGKSKKPLKYAIIVLLALFRVIGLVPIIIASALYDHPNDPTKDDGWNRMGSTFSLLIGMETIATVSLFLVFGIRLVKLIEELNHSDVESQHTIKVKAFLMRVKELIKRCKVLALPLLMVMSTTPVTQFIFGSLPFNYVFLGFTLLNVPLLLFIVAKYTSTASEKGEDHISSKNNSGGDSSLNGCSDRSSKDTKQFIQIVQPIGDFNPKDVENINNSNIKCQHQEAT